MPEELFTCESLQYSIGYKKILRKISFVVNIKSCGVITGDNGSGKSTLLQVLSRYDRFSQYIKWKKNLIPQKVKISYLGHEPGIYSSLSLIENIDYFNNILPSPMKKSQIDMFLEAFQLTKRVNDPINTFSQGMKQKAALIRSFLPEPYLYLFDEPMIGLDKKSVSQFIEILKELKNNSSILIVSHNPEVIKSITDFRINIENGISKNV